MTQRNNVNCYNLLYRTNIFSLCFLCPISVVNFLLRSLRAYPSFLVFLLLSVDRKKIIPYKDIMNRALEQFFLESWWVILFGLICYMLFEQGMKTRDHEYAKLQEHYADLEKQKKEVVTLQRKLLLEINSQSDPAWIELMLMKGLGLVPEGQIKVFFDQSMAKDP